MKRKRRDQDVTPFTGHVWESVIQVSWQTIPLKSLKCLSLTCKKFHSILKPIQESSDFCFCIPNNCNTVIFAPKNVKVESSDSIPTTATHVAFKKYGKINSSNFSKFSLMEHLRLPRIYKDIIIKFPPNLTHLILGEECNFPLKGLPNSLLYLSSGYSFDQPLDGDLPKGLKSLILNKSLFSQPLNNLPSSLTELEVGMYFNHPLHNLPPFLKKLAFDEDCGNFNQPLSHLPDSLEYLRLSSDFDQPISKFPPSLTYLEFGQYNSPIEDLPSSLKELVFSMNNIETMRIHNLPPNLTHLSLCKYDTNLLSTFPDTLTHVKLSCYYEKKAVLQTVENLPLSLTHLTFRHNFKLMDLSKFSSLIFLDVCDGIHCEYVYPTSLHHLRINLPHANKITTLSHLTSLSILELTGRYNSLLGKLPPFLTHLHMGTNYDCFNQPIDYLPSTLTYLTLPSGFNMSVDNLPSGLTHLTFGYLFNQPVDHLPSSLTHLCFGDSFNQPVDHLPPSLTHLTLMKCFHQPLEHLPSSLSYLEIHQDFKGSLRFVPLFTSVVRKKD